MLIQFRFQNFKSFRDDTILDLSATKITEHADRVVSLGGEKLLTIAAIFGANASGKSNVIKAFVYMTNYVLKSFAYGGGDGGKEAVVKRLEYTPFLFDAASREAESSFEVYFMDAEERGCKSYNYGFTLDRDGVVEEWLNAKAKTAREYSRIFYRNREELDLSGLPRESRKNLETALEREALLVSLGAKLKVERLKLVRDWFYSMNSVNFGSPIVNTYLSSHIPEGLLADQEARDRIVKYLSAFDPSIIGFEVEDLGEAENGKGRRVRIDAVHRTIDGGTTTISLRQESDGTLKMFYLYPLLRDTLEKGGVLLIDELNARLHPLLVRNFLLTFLNPEANPNHAQLIFTTHDAWQLSNNLLRRDEVWFTEKDGDGVSTLYSLADFTDGDGVKIRKDESYERNYLLGKYGAIPSLKCFDMFKEGE